MYRIGELSRLSQVPVRTLRYYDQIGVLVPARVATSGYRCYAAEQFEQLNRILVLKDLGLSLDEIRRLLADRASVDDLRALVARKHAELERRVEVERQRLTRAAARLALLDGVDGTPADIAVRTAGTQWIASLRKTIRTHDDCDGLHDELARAVRGRGQRGAIWHACAPGTIDCEAFAFLPAPIAPTRGIAVRQLPAQRVAARI
jgi:DNA-binding transcriptional MerR regulator